MDVAVQENINLQLHKMLNDLATFMSLYEQTDDRFKKQKDELEHQLVHFKNEIAQQINIINGTISEIREVMDTAGAARWRIAAEKSLNAGEEHLTSIKDATNAYQKLAEDSVTRLEHISLATEKRINNALNNLNAENSEVVEDFRRRSENIYGQLEVNSLNSINFLKKLMNWLRFDRISIAVIAGLLSAFFTSAYVNSEWPWESHQRTSQERLLGRTILTVWPSLTKAKQDEINSILGTKV